MHEGEVPEQVILEVSEMIAGMDTRGEGLDAAGARCAGVLEQSWRVGGATGAEVEALLAFRDDPALAVVRASTTERYGSDAAPPDGAIVYFTGTDERAGPLLKFTLIEPYVHAR